MSYVTIRRNSFKKIASILANAKGVIHCSSVMRIDDSYDSSSRTSDAETALTWLKENQEGASVYMSDKHMVITGPYYFCDRFTVYFNDKDFAAAPRG
ncbi:hypothetical protein C3Z09_22170 [Lelliottia aquatilis]|uniref:hypothetical protein n=1 Tax=Lelliottia aquatilis TaxID=2080838 RepID=UPI000CDE74BB|nr:hypothetical protein [Lelliottia aquatilis]POZ13649.1 hypothetical protein C3Z09_22170 [Lelliottia aquatilis]